MKTYTVKKWLTKILLKVIVYLYKDNNYIKHLKNEVPTWFDDTGPNKWIADGTAELLSVLCYQGHSGGSINFALNFFSTIAKFEPWGPLTGVNSEWGEPFDNDGTKQNLRCSRVFKGPDGRSYDIEGKIFREPSGACYTNIKSRVFINFPYIPKSEYIDVAD